MTVFTATVGAAALALASFGAAGPGAQTPATATPSTEKLEITAFAVNMSNMGNSGKADIDISITRWTTSEERARLIATMVDKGTDEMLKALQAMPSHGRFRIPGYVGRDPQELRLGHDLRYAWQTPNDDGGRRIVFITDRYVSFAEARSDPRASEYPFTIFELKVDKNGVGEGALAVATRIDFNKKKNSIELENYSSQPMQLKNVKVKSAS